MPEACRFFDSTPEDPRDYSMSEFAEYFNLLLTSGIWNGGPYLQVYCTGSDIISRIKVGYAWIKGYMYKVYDEDLQLTHDLPDPSKDRIDRIILRLDTTIEQRRIYAYIKKGLAVDFPKAPDLKRDDNIYEISLAQVTIKAGKSYIEPDQITDERFINEVCGLVNSMIQVDTSEMQQKFDTFMDSLSSEGFVPGQQFGSLNDLKTNSKDTAVAAINEASVSSNIYNATVNGSVIEVDTGGAYALVSGKVIKFKFTEAKTGITELKIDSNTALPIKDSSGAVVTDFDANTAYEVWYEDGGSPFFVLAPKGGSCTVITKQITTNGDILIDKVKAENIILSNKLCKIVATDGASQFIPGIDATINPNNLKATIDGELHAVELGVYTISIANKHEIEPYTLPSIPIYVVDDYKYVREYTDDGTLTNTLGIGAYNGQGGKDGSSIVSLEDKLYSVLNNNALYFDGIRTTEKYNDVGVMYDGSVFAVTSNRAVVKLAPTGLANEWSYATGWSFNCDKITIKADEYVAVIGSTHKPVIIDLNGNKLRDFELSTYSGYIREYAIHPSGDIIVGTANGQLIRANEDGTIVWSVSLSIPIEVIAVNRNGAIFVGNTSTNGIYGYDADGNQLWSDTSTRATDIALTSSGKPVAGYYRTVMIRNEKTGVAEVTMTPPKTIAGITTKYSKLGALKPKYL